jgi:hypothetical protein
MPTIDPEYAAFHRRMMEMFGSREGHLLWQLEQAARTGDPFDVTFYNREPILDVTLDSRFASRFIKARERDDVAMGYGGKPSHIFPLLREIAFSDGSIVDVADIWTMNWMPPGIAAHEAADLADAEPRAGLNGETCREMLRNTYRCASPAEEDWFVRRWIAS